MGDYISVVLWCAVRLTCEQASLGWVWGRESRLSLTPFIVHSDPMVELRGHRSPDERTC